MQDTFCHMLFLLVCFLNSTFKLELYFDFFFDIFWRVKSRQLMIFMAMGPDASCSKLNLPSGFSILLPGCSLDLFVPFISTTLKLTKYANKVVALLWFPFTLEVYPSTQAQLSLHAKGFHNNFVSFQF